MDKQEELREELRKKITNLAVGMMVISGKLKVEDLGEDGKDRLEEICQLTFDQTIKAFIKLCESRNICEVVDEEVPDSLCQGCSCYHIKNGRAIFKKELDGAGYKKVKPVSSLLGGE